MTGIYKITSPTGKVYIGQSVNIKQRWKQYYGRAESCMPIDRSIAKYGRDRHLFEVIYQLPSDVSQQVLDEYEILFIEAYRSTGVALLNIRGGGSKGKLSNETKQKIGKANSVSLIGNKPPNTGMTLAEYYGEDRSQEIKEKIRRKLVGRVLSAETIERRKATYKIKGHHAKGTKASEELRKKLSDAHKGVQAGENHPMKKLTNNEVITIFKSTERVVLLAAKYNVTIQSVYFIKNGKTWSHLTKDLIANHE